MSYHRSRMQKAKDMNKYLNGDCRSHYNFWGGYYYDSEKRRIIRYHRNHRSGLTKKWCRQNFNRRNRRRAKQMLRMGEYDCLPQKKSNDMWWWD